MFIGPIVTLRVVFARLLCALSWAHADCADKEVVLPIVDLLWRSL